MDTYLASGESAVEDFAGRPASVMADMRSATLIVDQPYDEREEQTDQHDAYQRHEYPAASTHVIATVSSTSSTSLIDRYPA